MGGGGEQTSRWLGGEQLVDVVSKYFKISILTISTTWNQKTKYADKPFWMQLLPEVTSIDSNLFHYLTSLCTELVFSTCHVYPPPPKFLSQTQFNTNFLYKVSTCNRAFKFDWFWADWRWKMITWPKVVAIIEVIQSHSQRVNHQQSWSLKEFTLNIPCTAFTTLPNMLADKSTSEALIPRGFYFRRKWE